MLTLRLDPNDYSVHEDGQPIGRIRYAKERSPGSMVVVGRRAARQRRSKRP